MAHVQTSNEAFDFFALDHAPGAEDTWQDFTTLLELPVKPINISHLKFPKTGKEIFLGESESFIEVITAAKRLKGTKAPVLITGESGTGKELLAQFIHQLEGNPERPFVAVHCGAIPEHLIESELFGHERGAFTGAMDRRIGYFERANGGDIFLDEISTLKPELQVKLLRVLQEKKIYRLGSKEPIDLDFRVIAASNDNLKKLIECGQFRLDLYHRLAVIPLCMPSLRARAEDIPLLVDCFIEKYQPTKKLNIDSDAMQLLQNHYWPGNVRELENVVWQMLLLLSDGKVTKKILLKIFNSAEMQHGISTDIDVPLQLREYIEDSEKELILEVLEKTEWNISKTARELKVARNTLYKKIRLYKLHSSS